MDRLSEGSADRHSHRDRHPTEKALQLLLDQEERLITKTEDAWKHLQHVMHLLSTTRDPERIASSKSELQDSLLQWRSLIEKRKQVLKTINNDEALARLQALLLDAQNKEKDFNAVYETIQFQLQEFEQSEAATPSPGSLKSSKGFYPSQPQDAKSSTVHRSHVSSSHRSHSRSSRVSESCSSHRSWTSSMAAQQFKEVEKMKLRAQILQAEAESAMADQEFNFSQKELDLFRRKAEIKAREDHRKAEIKAQEDLKEAEIKAQEDLKKAEIEAQEIILLKAKNAAKLAVKAKILAKTFQDELSEENVRLLPTEDINTKMTLLLANQGVASKEQSPIEDNSDKVLHSTGGERSLPQFNHLPSTAAAYKEDENPFKAHKSIAGSQPYMLSSCPPAPAMWFPSDPRLVKEDKTKVPKEEPIVQDSSFHNKVTEREKPVFSTPYQMFPTPSEAWNSSLFKSPKRDLKDKGVQKFSDKPEDFLLWKVTFKRAIRDLRLSADEELTLLIAWLGPTSSLQVQRVYAAYVSDPERALETAWTRLHDKYGASTEIEASLLNRLDKFPTLKLKDYKQLWDLSDLLIELESAKCNPELPGLACLDQYMSQRQILQKLPFHFQEAWGKEVFAYKEQNMQRYPPFAHLVAFITRTAKERNDPQTGFPTLYQNNPREKSPKTQKGPSSDAKKSAFAVKSTEVIQQRPESGPETKQILCPIHKKPHSLADCTEFAKKPYDERVSIVEKAKACFKCCGSQSHYAKQCKAKIKCAECSSTKHCTAMHNFKDKATNSERKISDTATKPVPDDHKEEKKPVVACTKLCQDSSQPRICHPICLAEVFPNGKPQLKRRVYVALDSQSDASLATPSFFDMFKIKAKTIEYIMFTCTGQQQLQGRIASNFTISPCDSEASFKLPTLLECSTIPRNKGQIATKSIARSHPHLKRLEREIPHLDSKAEISLLIGSDCPELFQILEQIKGPPRAPIAQRLPLGWVVIGPVCIDKMCPPATFNLVGNSKFPNSRPTQMQSCLSHIRVCCLGIISNCSSIFETTHRDEDLSFSRDEQRFLDILNKETVQSEEGNWIAPLPFKDVRPILPNNRVVAEKRLLALKRRMDNDSNLKSQIIKFMQDLFDCNYAETAPQLDKDTEQWFLPFHKVTHPQKPDKVRIVFDSSAKMQDVSLNDVLLKGPDLLNSLLGVILRFRKHRVAVTADIQKMFYAFLVRPDHRRYLKFLWFQDTESLSQITEFCMRVHVFGNTPSPAVANYCLKKTAEIFRQQYSQEVYKAVNSNFYVDDLLISFDTIQEANQVVKDIQDMLKNANIKLHKVMSNSIKVLKAFPTEDLIETDLKLLFKDLQTQSSLGIVWNVKTDQLSLRSPKFETQNSKRKVLSSINSIYDPLGIAAPVLIIAKDIFRKITLQIKGWDQELSPPLEEAWKAWVAQAKDIEKIKIPRQYVPTESTTKTIHELHIFCDASKTAVAAVAYIRVKHGQEVHIGFMMAKSKVAPEQTIPRLELCAALLATQLMQIICKETEFVFQRVCLYTDSMIVLGYLRNSTKKFKVYIANRINKILSCTQSHQWFYISTKENPADVATRGISAHRLPHTNWLTGPKCLTNSEFPEDNIPFELPELPEALPEINTFKTEVTHISKVSESFLESTRFERFSKWHCLRRAIARLIHKATFKEAAAPSAPDLFKAKVLMLKSAYGRIT